MCGSCSVTGPSESARSWLADLGVSVAGYELLLMASPGLCGVVVWSPVRVAAVVLAAVGVRAGSRCRWLSPGWRRLVPGGVPGPRAGCRGGT